VVCIEIVLALAASLLNGCNDTSPFPPHREYKLVLFGVEKMKTPANFFGPKSDEYLLPFEITGGCGQVQWIPKISWVAAADIALDPSPVNETTLFAFSDIKSRGTRAEQSGVVDGMRSVRLEEIARQMLVELKFDAPTSRVIANAEPSKSSPLEIAAALVKGRGIVARKATQAPGAVEGINPTNSNADEPFAYPDAPIVFGDVDSFRRNVDSSLCRAPKDSQAPTVVMMVAPHTIARPAEVGGLPAKGADAPTKQPPPMTPSEVTTNAVKVSADSQRAFDRGMNYVQQGNLDLAIKEFSSAINLSQKYAAAFANRGVAQLRQKNYGRALDDFKKSIELEPQNAVWHYNLAAYYSLKQETDRGLDSLDRALTLGFAKTENTQIDLLKFDAKADPDLINLRKRRTDYCAVLERHGKFLCK